MNRSRNFRQYRIIRVAEIYAINLRINNCAVLPLYDHTCVVTREVRQVMIKYRVLKKAITSNGQFDNGKINGKPISFLLSYWDEEYSYSENISFKIKPLTFKVPTNVVMYIAFDAQPFGFEEKDLCENKAFYEDILLRYFHPVMEELNQQFSAVNKLERLYTKISCERPDNRIIRRNGLIYKEKENVFVLKLFVLFPSGSGISIMGNKTAKMIGAILKGVEDSYSLIDKNTIAKNAIVYKNQKTIRRFCEENHYKAFIANGSILPRNGDSREPLARAIPFQSPASLQREIPMPDGTKIIGMAIPCGITVITGAGFSGKTTVLEAVQSGIYNYIPGDGREYVIADESLLTANAEDGRFVGTDDISLFFKNIPFQDVHHFSTDHASGSVSQAVNVCEAIYAGSRLLTIDEDKSATNFMIRDEIMRRIVKNEIIIPLTDRVRQVYRQKDISVILVIGGSSEYLKIADTVILMDEYVPVDVSGEINETIRKTTAFDEIIITNREKRIVHQREKDASLFMKTVCTEDSKKAVCGKYVSDLTQIPSIENSGQLQTIALAMKEILPIEEEESEDLADFALRFQESLFEILSEEMRHPEAAYCEKWFDEVRKEDVLMGILRMRGARFT